MVERDFPKVEVRGFETRLPLTRAGRNAGLIISDVEWIVVFVLALIVLTLFTLRRSGWESNFTFNTRRNDLTQRERMAEDDVRRMINERDKDIAP